MCRIFATLVLVFSTIMDDSPCGTLINPTIDEISDSWCCYSINRICIISGTDFGNRSLFADSFVRIRDFNEQSEEYAYMIRGKEALFWKRVEEMIKVQKVYQWDLKIATHVTDQEHFPLCFKLLKCHYSDQALHGGLPFRYGPVVLRRLHVLKDADTALKVFYDEELHEQCLFSGAVLVLFDLLFEDGRYDELARAFEVLMTEESLSIQNSRLPVLAYLLSLYKIGSPEAFEKAVRFWEEHGSKHASYFRITYAYAAILMKKGDFSKAISVLEPVVDSPMGLNLFIQANLAGNRWEAVREILSKPGSKIIFTDTYSLLSSRKFEFKCLRNIPAPKSCKTVEDELCVTINMKGPVKGPEELMQKRMNRSTRGSYASYK